MCGLYAFAGDAPDLARLYTVARAASRRGPHAWGYAWWEDGRLNRRAGSGVVPPGAFRGAGPVIGQGRLASNGRWRNLDDAPPLLSADGRIGVVHNGVILSAGGEHAPSYENDSRLILTHLEADHRLPDIINTLLRMERPDIPQAAICLIDGRITAVPAGHPLWLYEAPEGDYLCSRPFPDANPLKGVYAR